MLTALKSKPFWKNLLFLIAGAACALTGYILPLAIGVPDEMGRIIGRTFHWSFLGALLILYLAYRLPGRPGTLLSATLSFVPFSIVLAAMWNGDFREYSALGGLLPWSDASGYYQEARRLLEGYLISSWGSRRPLFPSLLAVLLGLTGQNLQLALAILVFITTACIYLLVYEVRRSHGAVAGVVALAVLFLFYRLFIGSALTENLGLALGALSMAIIWRGTGKSSMPMIVFGILILTVALNARAGAFFVLPALLLWGMWFFRKQVPGTPVFFIAGAGAIVLGFALSFLVLRTVTSPDDSMAFSNYSYVLYGLSVGGKGWTQVYTDHPEVLNMPEIEAARTIYQFAFAQIIADPRGLLQGMWVALQGYFDSNATGELSYAPTAYQVRPYLHGLFLLSLIYVAVHRKGPYTSLLFAASLGVIASAPFAPPADAGLMRVYAATIPLTAALLAVGASRVITLVAAPRATLSLEEVPPVQPPGRRFWSFLGEPVVLAGMSLVGLVVVGPLIVRLLQPPVPHFSGSACASGLDARYVRMSAGSSVTLVDDTSLRARVPLLRKDQFLEVLQGTTVEIKEPLGHVLSNARYPVTIMNAFDMREERTLWLIGEQPTGWPDKGIVKVCGNIIPELAGYGVFQVISVEPIHRDATRAT